MTSAPAWLDDAIALDERLFLPGSLWGLQVDNSRAPGVVVPTARHGLELVQRGGRVASIVGHLRRDFVAVDVDAEGPIGRIVTDQLSRWLRGRGWWHVMRPSGGAAGRHHFYVRVDLDAEAQLRAYAGQLREQHGLAAKHVDVRRHMRLLAAPHRNGTRPAPLGNLRQALKSLPHSDSDAGTGPSASRTGDERLKGRPDVEALTPLPRRRRAIAPEWATYLATGQRPPIGGADHGQSTYELRVTAELLHAGYSADEAWGALVDAHPDAVAHVMHPRRRRAWWTRRWNQLVESDRAWRTENGLTGPADAADLSQAFRIALAGARAALERLLGSCGRERHTVYLVGSVLLDRVQRTGDTTVPIPQRDFEKDTGLSRPTVAAALRRLDGVLGVLHESFDPGDRERSSHTFEIYPRSRSGVGQSLPPVFHAPTGTWQALPTTAHSLWRHLPPAASPGVALEELAQVSGFSPAPGQAPTVHQLRTVRRHLAALAAAGLASCDAEGRWTHADPAEAWSAERVQHAAAAAAPVVDRIESERRTYRAAPGNRWRHERTLAIERDHAHAARRYAAWRSSLGTEGLRERSERYTAQFHALSPTDQTRVKDRLALARRRRGELDEAQRHDEWCRSMSATEYADRAAARQAAYFALDPLQRAQRVAEWTDHRRRWSVPRGHPDQAPSVSETSPSLSAHG